MSAARELVPARNNGCTLYELEGTLQALADSIYLSEEPSARELILDEIGQVLRKTKEKRDAVVAFLSHCEQQQAFADAEIERIRKRKDFIAKVQATLESRLVQVIDQFAAPDRKGIKRLVGHFSSMRIQKNPDTVVITDELALPAAWKDVILTIPADTWADLLGRLDLGERTFFQNQIKKSEVKPDKRAIAGELKNGHEIPGADLKFGEFRLVIE